MTWQRKFDFEPGQKISSDQVDQEFNQIIGALNKHDEDISAAGVAAQAAITFAKNYGIGGNAANVTNADNIALTGFYKLNGGLGSSGGPDNGSYLINHLQYSDSSAVQIAYRTGSQGSQLNDIYFRQKNGNPVAWESWIPIYRNNNRVLWEGASMPVASTVITPEIPLDKTVNGWVLVWSDYDPPTSTAKELNYTLTLIHKTQPKKETIHSVGSFLDDTSSKTTTKILTHTNTTITGNDNNSLNTESKDVVLRQILLF